MCTLQLSVFLFFFFIPLYISEYHLLCDPLLMVLAASELFLVLTANIIINQLVILLRIVLNPGHSIFYISFIYFL